MAETVAFKLPELVDLALCTPVVGVVNFNILRIILHTMIKSLRLEDVHPPVSIVEMLQTPVAGLKKMSFMNLEEDDTVSGTLQDQVSAIIAHSQGQLTEPQEEFLQTVARASADQTTGEAEAEGAEGGEAGSRSSSRAGESGELPEAPPPSQEQRTVDHEDRKHMVTQMWRITNLTRRTDALEQAVENIVAMLDAHEKNLRIIRRDFKGGKGANSEEIKAKFETIEKSLEEMTEKVNEVERLFREHMTEASQKLGDVGEMIRELNQMKGTVEDLDNLIKENFTPEKLDQMAMLAEKVKDIDDRTSQMFDYIEEDVLSENADRFSSLSEITEDFLKNPKHLGRVVQELVSQVFKIRERLTELEEIGAIVTQGAFGGEGAGGGGAVMHDIEDKIDELQIQVERLAAGTSELLNDRTNTAQLIENLQNCFDHLDQIKANKEAVASAIDLKADRSELEERVSKEEFENTCQELSLGFEELLSKLATQEVACMRATEELNDSLEKKVDVDTLNSLRQKIQNHIKKVLIKIRKMSEMIDVGSATAAGIKVKCISCDRPSKMEERIGALRGNTTWVDPYEFEGATDANRHMHPGAKPCKGFMPPPSSGDRYQSGRHTVSYPNQRRPSKDEPNLAGDKVWDSTNIAGTDNLVYKGVLEKPPKLRQTIDVDFGPERSPSAEVPPPEPAPAPEPAPESPTPPPPTAAPPTDAPSEAEPEASPAEE